MSENKKITAQMLKPGMVVKNADDRAFEQGYGWAIDDIENKILSMIKENEKNKI